MPFRIPSSPLLFIICFSLLWLLVSAQEPRELHALSTKQLEHLLAIQDPEKSFDLKNPNSHLSKILIPRPPDTQNNTLVRQYIVSTLKALRWDVEEDSFSGATPYGLKQFTNVIATKDPHAPRRVVLAAHFDSKFFATSPQNQFVGATDSAMPCALMLDVAQALNPFLEARATLADSGLNAQEEEAAETTLQLIFFDGEEAFKDWTDTDSVYGARHLAERWETEYIPPSPKRRMSYTHTYLESIDNLILLDLLGAQNPRIRSYFMSTSWMFDGLIDVENRLAAANIARTSQSFFEARAGHQQNWHGIGDDHVPFMNRGVSILHVIASPFPSVWHTLADDASALDMPTMRKWNMIFRVFMAEYLDLQIEGTARERDVNDLT